MKTNLLNSPTDGAVTTGSALNNNYRAYTTGNTNSLSGPDVVSGSNGMSAAMRNQRNNSNRPAAQNRPSKGGCGCSPATSPMQQMPAQPQVNSGNIAARRLPQAAQQSAAPYSSNVAARNLPPYNLPTQK